MLSDVVYRIQKSRKAKPKVVHSDRLKPYLGPPLERWIPKRQTQLSKPREEERKASDVDSPVFVEDGQSAPINEREGVEFVEAEATVGEEDDALGQISVTSLMMQGNLELARNCQLLVRNAITKRMSAVKQWS